MVKTSLGVGSVKLQEIYNTDSKVISMPEMGLSIRLTLDGDARGNKNLGSLGYSSDICML